MTNLSKMENRPMILIDNMLKRFHLESEIRKPVVIRMDDCFLIIRGGNLYLFLEPFLHSSVISATLPLLTHAFWCKYLYNYVKCCSDFLFISVKFIHNLFKKCSTFYKYVPPVWLPSSSSSSSSVLNKYCLRHCVHVLSLSLFSPVDISRSFHSSSGLTMSSSKKLDALLSVQNEEVNLCNDGKKGNDHKKTEGGMSPEGISGDRSAQCPGHAYIAKDVTTSDKTIDRSLDESGDTFASRYFELESEESPKVTNLFVGSNELNGQANLAYDNYARLYYELMNRVTNSREDSAEPRLTHTDMRGKAQMVDVGGKATTPREARAQATIYLGEEAGRLVKENKMKKGDVLTVAQIAGIMAAKQTPQLIPLCHSISLTKVDVTCVLNEETHSVDITSLVRTVGVTGVEMEALTAVSVAALTIYDMCKAVTHDMVISDIMLLSKSGGKQDFRR